MPGREDFGKLKARALGDPRVMRAAERYVEQRIACEETAVGTVLGHVACLGLWASRETDDGHLSGDGVAVVCAATMVAPSTARRVVAALSAADVDLLTQDGDGLRLRGFASAYGGLMKARKGARGRAAKSRARHANGARDGSSATGDADGARHANGARDVRARHANSARDVRARHANTGGVQAAVGLDVTRDVTRTSHDRGEERREELPPLPSADAEGSGGDAAPQRDNGTALTPGERAAAQVIATAIERGELRLEADAGMTTLDTELSAAERAVRMATNGNDRTAAERRRDESKAARAEAERVHRRTTAEVLRSGDADARPLIERWEREPVMVGPKEHRVALSAACLAARREARADAREVRRRQRAPSGAANKTPAGAAPATTVVQAGAA